MSDTKSFSQRNREVHERILRQCSSESVQIGEDFEESTPAPLAIDEEALVSQVTFTNEAGGTAIVTGRIVVIPKARWWDYETGWHFSGEFHTHSDTVPLLDTFTGKPPAAVPRFVQFSQFSIIAGSQRQHARR